MRTTVVSASMVPFSFSKWVSTMSPVLRGRRLAIIRLTNVSASSPDTSIFEKAEVLKHDANLRAAQIGPLPEMPNNMDLVAGLAGDPPKDCFIVPMTVREKTVCFLYLDNAEDGVGGLQMADLRRLAAKAGLAFQVYLIKSKIRTI